MLYQRIVLLVVSLMVTIVFFKLPYYNRWLDQKVLLVYRNFYNDMDAMEFEERRERTYGPVYNTCIDIKNQLADLKAKDPLVLIPPDKYIKHFNPQAVIPEPVVFYYFAGMKTVASISPDVYKANWGILVEDQRLFLVPLTTKQQVDEVLSVYKKTPGNL